MLEKIKSHKKAFILLLSVVVIGSFGILYFSLNVKNDYLEDSQNTNSKIENNEIEDNEIINNSNIDDDKNEEIEENKGEESTVVEEKIQVDNTPKNNTENSSNSSSNNKEVKTQEKENNISSHEKDTSSNIEQNKPQDEPKEKEETGIWDKLGMTKDQYYNEPLYNWERVDFDASVCGTEENCLNECALKGDTYENQMYSCEIVTSASGRFLGVMLDLEEIN